MDSLCSFDTTRFVFKVIIIFRLKVCIYHQSQVCSSNLTVSPFRYHNIRTPIRLMQVTFYLRRFIFLVIFVHDSHGLCSILVPFTFPFSFVNFTSRSETAYVIHFANFARFQSILFMPAACYSPLRQSMVIDIITSVSVFAGFHRFLKY